LAVVAAAVAIRLAVSASFKGHSFMAPRPVKPEPEAAYLKRGEIGLGDSEQYLLLGASIRHRLSYTWNHEPNTFRTPGYPLLLALLDDNVTAIVVVQALLAGLTVFLTGFLGLRLFNARTGLFGAALLAVDIPSIFSSGMVMSEVLFTFCVVLAAALLLGRGIGGEGRETGDRRPRGKLHAALGGFTLGFAVLVRPVALLAFVPFGIALMLRREWRGVVVMLVTFSLLPATWVGRNYFHYHRLSLTSNGGYNLLYANAAALKGAEQRITWDSARVELAHEFTSQLGSDNPLVLASAMTRRAGNIILHDPLRYVWTCLWGIPKIVVGIKSDDIVLRALASKVPTIEGSVLLNRKYVSMRVRRAVWLLAGFELLTAIGAFLLALVSLGLRGWRAEKFLLVLIGLYFVAVALPLTDGRFRVPAMPFFYLAAATVFTGSARKAKGAVAGAGT